MGRIVKPFSFDPVRDKDILSHLDAQGNASEYVRNLIRLDMGGNLVEQVVGILLAKIGNPTTAPPTPRLREHDVRGVLNILNRQ